MADQTQRRVTMVDTQVRPSDVTKFPIIDAMLSIPRESFVPLARRDAAYAGEHIDLGHGGRVILDPRTLAKLLDAVDVQPDEMVLDIAPGLGYSSAIIARMSEAVVAVENAAELVAEAETALSDAGIDNVAVIEGPLAEGSAKHGPYDVVLIQGGVEHIPDALIAQVKDGGRIAAIFNEGTLGVARIGYKIDGAVTWRYAFNAGAPVLPGFEKARAFLF